jgi:Icc-related predicted phosphoesterase
MAHGLLPAWFMAEGMFRLAAMADLHYSSNSRGKYASVFSRIGQAADVLLLCGDLVDSGLATETKVLVSDLEPVLRRIPIVAVLGNHDFESGAADQVSKILSEAGVKVLDGDSCEIQGIGFAGVKGFGGGFGERRLQPWGEEIIKSFVREAVAEAMKLESALARLRGPQRIALLHYSPVASTIFGEPPEIFPFLGSSHLEEPLNRYPVTAVFHGHAHYGTVAGETQRGTPVYNVAVKLLEQTFPNRPPYRTLELPRVNASS